MTSITRNIRLDRATPLVGRTRYTEVRTLGRATKKRTAVAVHPLRPNSPFPSLFVSIMRDPYCFHNFSWFGASRLLLTPLSLVEDYFR